MLCHQFSLPTNILSFSYFLRFCSNLSLRDKAPQEGHNWTYQASNDDRSITALSTQTAFSNGEGQRYKCNNNQQRLHRYLCQESVVISRLLC